MLRLWFALAILVYSPVAAEPGIFYNPPTGGPIHVYKDNPVYELGQTVQLRWATSLEYLSLMLWQNDNPDYEWLQTNLSGVTTYNWVVSTQRNLKDGNVFFFQIRDANDLNSANLFASHYFNITNNDADPTTTASSSATKGTTTMTSPTLSLSTSITTTPSSASPTASSGTTSGGGLSPQATVGVGVGVGLGCAFVLVLGAVIWYFRRRVARRHKLSTNPGYLSGNSTVLLKPYISQPPPPPQQQPAAEVPGESRHQGRRYELQ
ncbi:hypothetical protein ABOM_000108 [Aspergillus bombycis]|uniref:Mid2 domain-containing protein n=1 Tax=Aspergillus bombycis TaxID=109264 RepID=A0A1F8AI58_9EURO|nr:hypothetical protein ABOM_000108 [Aspergillus bombycis]OGM51372.1 hypothetical protein ABOM_000108 [Aspergillus bombycis]